MHVEVDNGFVEHESEKELNGDVCVNKVRVKTDIQPSTLRFEVDLLILFKSICHCFPCFCMCIWVWITDYL